MWVIIFLFLVLITTLMIYEDMVERKKRRGERTMTNCKICNREVDTEGDWWCNACLNDYPTNNDYPADSDDVAEWAADRAREFERDRTNKLIEELEAEVERLKEVREGQVAHTATLFSYWEDLAVEAGWSKAEDLASPMQFIRQFVRTRLVPNSSKPTAEQERAAVVAWLTRQGNNPSIRISTTFKNLSTLIERGEHWPEDGE